MNKFNLNILGFENEIFFGKAQSLRARAVDGGLEVLAGHVPYINLLSPGKILVTLENNSIKEFDSCGGVLKVSTDSVDLLLSQ